MNKVVRGLDHFALQTRQIPFLFRWIIHVPSYVLRVYGRCTLLMHTAGLWKCEERGSEREAHVDNDNRDTGAREDMVLVRGVEHVHHWSIYHRLAPVISSTVPNFSHIVMNYYLRSWLTLIVIPSLFCPYFSNWLGIWIKAKENINSQQMTDNSRLRSLVLFQLSSFIFNLLHGHSNVECPTVIQGSRGLTVMYL